MDPQLNSKKLMENFSKVTLDGDLLPQEHPNNQNSEMVYEEFQEVLMRCARQKVMPQITTIMVVMTTIMS